MSRFNTGNALPSISEEDMYDNCLSLDEAMNSTNPTWRDRFNVEKPTIDAALKSAGFMPAGFDFVTGGTLQPGDRNKAVYNPAPNGDNNWYRWNGVFPKEIAANSQPNPKNENNWVLAHFRIGIVEKEALRRSYAEAGYNLVDGSFEGGATINTSTDALLYGYEGKAYSWGGVLPKLVPANSTPASTGGLGVNAWLDKSNSVNFLIDNVFLLSTIPEINGSIVKCRGHSSVLDGGEGDFIFIDSFQKSLHDGGRYISPTVPSQPLDGFIAGTGETDPAGNGVWVRRGVAGTPHRLREYGIIGSSDDSAAMFAWMTKLAGKKWLIDSTPSVFNIGMVGSAFNGTDVKFASGCYIKNKNITRVDTGLYGTRAAFYIKDVDGVTGDWFGDGNRAGQPDAENCHNLAIYGSKNIDFGKVRFKELRGDGIYLTQSNATASSTIPENINISDFKAENSTDDGRNALSIISAKGVKIGKFTSLKIGGIVGGVTQPGGFDIEPNQSYQTVDDVVLGDVYIDTAGNFGLQSIGKGNGPTGGNVNNVDFGRYTVISRCPSAVGVTPVSARLTNKVRGVGYTEMRGLTQTSNHVGLLVEDSSAVSLIHESVECGRGARIGYTGRVVDSDIKVTARGYTYCGASLGAIDRSSINVTALAAKVSTAFPIYLRSIGTTTESNNVSYSVKAPSSATGTTHGVYNEPVSGAITFANSEITGDLYGYSSHNNRIFNITGGLRRKSVLGVNWAPSMPTNGAWTKGDFVTRDTPAITGTFDCVFGWMRITDGDNNVLNTDWVQLSAKTNVY